MIRKLTVISLLIGVVCLLGGISALAYQEAPMLRALVAAGELPPVEERLPEELLVVEPVEEIGQYGGTIQVFARDASAWNDFQPGEEYDRGGLFLFSSDGQGRAPDLATKVEISEDRKTFTLYLRRGVKWSDGAPCTVDDLIFQYVDVYDNRELVPVRPRNLPTLVKIDDYTVRYEYEEPVSNAVTWGVQSMIEYPKHYLKKWHIKYNPKANELAKEEGFDYWWQALPNHAQWYPQQSDLDCPKLRAFIYKESTAGVKVLERNPYYYKVDTAGNQLPYIDKVVIQVVDMEVFQLKAISGEADYAYEGLGLDNYPLYKENEEAGNYRVILMPISWANAQGIAFNFNEHDPVLRKIYHDIRFRRALSVAINRDEISESVFFGKATPRQGAPLPGTSYYQDKWAESYIQYDPDMANGLLDEMGLEWDKKHEYRLRPDGKTLAVTIEHGVIRAFTASILELVREYWGVVGVDVSLKSYHKEALRARSKTSEHGLISWENVGGEEWTILGNPRSDYGYGEFQSWYYDWCTWDGPTEDGAQLQQPGDTITYQDVNDHWARIMKFQYEAVVASKEYMELAEQIMDWWSENLVNIGIVGGVPQPMIISNNIGNVPDPERDFQTSAFRVVNQHGYSQWFFKK